jgi:hypothetical protein
MRDDRIRITPMTRTTRPISSALIAALLAIAACGGGKKAPGSPADTHAEPGATGGAAYGGQGAARPAADPAAPK